MKIRREGGRGVRMKESTERTNMKADNIKKR
jgi:hypothetical protein